MIHKLDPDAAAHRHDQKRNLDDMCSMRFLMPALDVALITGPAPF
ncbi:hypothetical protein [Allokutzneria albata]|nr:hypothetical protein [Allokutzneria albata]